MSSPYEPFPQDQSGGYGQQPGGYGQPQYPQGYLQGGPVGFGDAVSLGFKNVTTFNGRASRPAFWWYALAIIIIDVVIQIIANAAKVPALSYVADVVFALLTLAAAVRRLHDSGRSGFWWLIGLIPIVGTIVLIVFYCLPGTPGPNKYDAAA
jgi:uncharacterized membrane protein YhaH (DUF805 family)